MYLKFGFGRATQDAGIEIRRGAMDRDQALNLVNLYENTYPDEFLEIYLLAHVAIEISSVQVPQLKIYLQDYEVLIL